MTNMNQIISISQNAVSLSNGKTYVAHIQRGCSGCAFETGSLNNICSHGSLRCCNSERTDGNPVIWVEAVENKRHTHADLIIAWANGAEIEYFNPRVGKWQYMRTPAWDEDDQYRIKQQSKPDTTNYVLVDINGLVFVDDLEDANVKCIFDGQTGKLKVIEMVNKND